MTDVPFELAFQIRSRQALEAWRNYYGLWPIPDWLIHRLRSGWTWPPGYTGYRTESGAMIMAGSDNQTGAK